MRMLNLDPGFAQENVLGMGLGLGLGLGLGWVCILA